MVSSIASSLTLPWLRSADICYSRVKDHLAWEVKGGGMRKTRRYAIASLFSTRWKKTKTKSQCRRTSQSTSPRQGQQPESAARRERLAVAALLPSSQQSTPRADASFDCFVCRESTITCCSKKNTSRTKSVYERPRLPRKDKRLAPMSMLIA